MLKDKSVYRQFSRAAESYQHAAAVQHLVAKNLLKLLPQDRDFSKIIDLGCGTGNLTLELSRLFPEAFIRGVDISESMIEQAKIVHQHNKIIFDICDAKDFASNLKFELVASSSALHWMQPMIDYLLSWKHLLEQDGLLLLSLMVNGTLWELHDLKSELYPNKASKVSLPEQRDIITSLQNAGFLVECYKEQEFIEHFQSVDSLIHSLKSQGVTGGQFSRNSKMLNRRELNKLCEEYSKRYSTADGRVTGTFKVCYITATLT